MTASALMNILAVTGKIVTVQPRLVWPLHNSNMHTLRHEEPALIVRPVHAAYLQVQVLIPRRRMSKVKFKHPEWLGQQLNVFRIQTIHM